MVIGRIAAVGAAAASLALVAGPALANAPYTVSFSGTNPLTATAKGATVLSASGTSLSCSSSSVTANVHAGTYSTSPANNVATISAASWSGCTLGGTFPATVTVTSPSWSLNITDPNSQTSGLTDVINGNISNISNVAVDVNILGIHCKFNVSGSVPATFKEDNGKGGQEIDIAAGSGLTVNNTTAGCLGQVTNNSPATFTGQYNWAGQPVNVS